MSSACPFCFRFTSCAWAEQERAKEADRGLQRLEQREAMADKAEEVTKMAVTVFHCKEVRKQPCDGIGRPVGLVVNLEYHQR